MSGGLEIGVGCRRGRLFESLLGHVIGDRNLAAGQL